MLNNSRTKGFIETINYRAEFRELAATGESPLSILFLSFFHFSLSLSRTNGRSRRGKKNFFRSPLILFP